MSNILIATLSKTKTNLNVFFKLMLIALLYLGINYDTKANNIGGNDTNMSRSCATVYEHVNYQGHNFEVCLGQLQGYSNETNYSYNQGIGVSSFKVPKDASLIVCTDYGKCVIYFNDVASLSPYMNDQIRSIRIIRFKYKDFVTFFASDPQYPWACRRSSCGDRKVADEDNSNQVRSINLIKDKIGNNRTAGLIVNGDLTQWGHADELSRYKDFFEAGLNMNSYPGLGNHDYENNVGTVGYFPPFGGAYNNDQPSRMVEYLLTKLWNLKVRDVDLSYNGGEINGSYSYSWDIGNVHFIQLNNHMNYTKSWPSYDWKHAYTKYFNVRPSYDFLIKDLAKARAENKVIIVNVHDIQATAKDPRFLELLRRYKVAGVFTGHLHQIIGQSDAHTFKNALGDNVDIPVFFSGSSEYNSFLSTRFLQNNMIVYKHKSYPSDTKNIVGVYPTEYQVLRGMSGTLNGTPRTVYLKPMKIRMYLPQDSSVHLKLDTPKSNAVLRAYGFSSSNRTWNLYKGKNDLEIHYLNSDNMPNTPNDVRIENNKGTVGFGVIHGRWLPGGGPDINSSDNNTYVYTAPPTDQEVTFTLSARGNPLWWVSDISTVLYLTDLNGRIIAQKNGYQFSTIKFPVKANQKYLVVAATAKKGDIDEFALEVSEGILQ